MICNVITLYITFLYPNLPLYYHHIKYCSTGLAKKICPRLCDPASGRGGEFTQPRTQFLANSVCQTTPKMSENRFKYEICPFGVYELNMWGRCGCAYQYEYRMTLHLDSYILLQSIWGVPLACLGSS